MRKIEQAITAAIVTRSDAIIGNTATCRVEREDGKPLLRVLLHGNHIATVGYDDSGKPCNASGTLAGWDTRITRSRLSLVARALGDAAQSFGPCHRDGVPHVARRDGSYSPILSDTEFFAL
ncbi:hypothetical protein CPT_Suzuki_008 [Stenotrophomonas phage Suzuki]|nr:hypothetical protein CPT_Suzuki_008 [Stenotrophomonas phage Suzuki]